MQEQKYTLKEPECFNLKDIFTCGQCFRWKENEEKDLKFAACALEIRSYVKKSAKKT